MDIREALLELDVNFLVERFLVELSFNPESFLNRMNSVVTLAKKGATEGERGASREALKRMINRAEEEAKTMAPEMASRFLAKIKAIAASVDSKEEPAQSSSSYRSRPPPQAYAVGTWIIDEVNKLIGKVVSSTYADGLYSYTVRMPQGDLQTLWANIRKATQEEIDAALAKARTSTSSKSSNQSSTGKSADWQILKLAAKIEGKSDKVYGVASNGVTYITFWGRRAGPSYAFKQHSKHSAFDVFSVKTSSRGYKIITDSAMITRSLHILRRNNLPS